MFNKSLRKNLIDLFKLILHLYHLCDLLFFFFFFFIFIILFLFVRVHFSYFVCSFVDCSLDFNFSFADCLFAPFININTWKIIYILSMLYSIFILFSLSLALFLSPFFFYVRRLHRFFIRRCIIRFKWSQPIAKTEMVSLLFFTVSLNFSLKLWFLFLPAI